MQNIEHLNSLPINLPLCEKAVKWVSQRSATPAKIVISSHLERKAATWVHILSQYGNDIVFVPSNKGSVRSDALQLLESVNIPVEPPLDVSEEIEKDTLSNIESFSPSIVFDDGALLIRAIAENHERFPSLRGCVEFTTSGTNELQEVGYWPIVDMAHSFCKYKIGNPYGTGESTLSAIMSLTNISVSGLKVGVIGYGSVGKGIANTARKLGATVYVTDNELRHKVFAYFDGMIVCDLPDLLPRSDVIITCTGRAGTIDQAMLQELREGTYLVNVGAFRSDLPLKELRSESIAIEQVRPGIEAYHLTHGRKVYLLTNGELINLAYGAGWPVQLIDLSFCLSTLCFDWLENSQRNGHGIVAVPEELEQLALSWFVEHYIK